MKSGKYLILCLAICFLSVACKDKGRNEPLPPADSQLIYIGLKDETNIPEAQEFVRDRYGMDYRPCLKIMDDYVYVSSAYGLYRKSIAAANTAQWELYGFGGVPVRNFVKNGDRVLAITPNRNGKAFLLSVDDGKTYSAATPAAFLEESNGENPAIFGIAENPLNPNSLLTLSMTATGSAFGVLKSTDFGKNWKVLYPALGGYQNWFIGFHPLDTTNLYTTGEESYFDSFIRASYDDGQNWSGLEAVMNSCVHHIAFHPSDPETMLYSGEFMIKKTTDKGRTWKLVLSSDDMYIFKAVYDSSHPDIVYASGYHRNTAGSNRLTIYRSLNGGDDWSVFFEEEFPENGGVMDMELYRDKLFLYTFTDGIFVLNISGGG